MNKLSIAIFAGAMAMSTYSLAAPEVSPKPQATAEDCSKLKGKEKDKCIQATPAGPVDMKSGEERKAKSQIAKDRDRKRAAQGIDTGGQPKQRPPADPAQTGVPAEKTPTSGTN
jgi:hypothetical protein